MKVKTMKTRFIGDIHGKKSFLEDIIRNTPPYINKVIQVGDMGIGFGQGSYWHDSIDLLFESVNGGFIRGNHDNPQMCKTMKTFIPDGHVENDIMYVGGAWSIDSRWRTKDYDWWEDEELSIAELNTIIDVYDLVRPSVMITHDAPLFASKQMFFQPGQYLHGKEIHKTRTACALQTMFEIHQPKYWIFGHWHEDTDMTINGTRFICLDEASHIDLEV